MKGEYNILKVNIYGTDYPIKGNTDVEYIKKVANYVDSKMKEVNQSLTLESSLKVAILAALNIADELFREKAEKEAMVNSLEHKIKKLTNMLDESFKG